MVYTLLNKDQVVQYIGQHAPSYGLDPAAILSVANFEGLNTAPGSSWVVKGENAPSFGPPSWFSGQKAAGAPILAQQGSVANASAWSWSPAGLDYWLQQVAAAPGVVGTTGRDAIAAIVANFERPREDLRAGEITNAASVYQSFQTRIAAGFGQAIPIPLPPIPAPGQTTPAPSNPGGGGVTTPAPGPPTGGGSGATSLNFSDSFFHVLASGGLILLAIALILGGIWLLTSSKDLNVTAVVPTPGAGGGGKAAGGAAAEAGEAAEAAAV